MPVFGFVKGLLNIFSVGARGETGSSGTQTPIGCADRGNGYEGVAVAPQGARASILGLWRNRAYGFRLARREGLGRDMIPLFVDGGCNL